MKVAIDFGITNTDIAIQNNNNDSVEGIIRIADEALYKAKKKNRDLLFFSKTVTMIKMIIISHAEAN